MVNDIRSLRMSHIVFTLLQCREPVIMQWECTEQRLAGVRWRLTLIKLLDDVIKTGDNIKKMLVWCVRFNTIKIICEGV